MVSEESVHVGELFMSVLGEECAELFFHHDSGTPYAIHTGAYFDHDVVVADDVLKFILLLYLHQERL